MKGGSKFKRFFCVFIILAAVVKSSLWLRHQLIQRQVQQHIEEGARFDQASQLDQAAAEYQAALALDPGNPFALFNLGSVRKKQERWEEALAAYQEALPRSPEWSIRSAFVHSAIGDVYVHKGQSEPALREFQYTLDLLLRLRKSARDSGLLSEIDNGIREMQTRIAAIRPGDEKESSLASPSYGRYEN